MLASSVNVMTRNEKTVSVLAWIVVFAPVALFVFVYWLFEEIHWIAYLLGLLSCFVIGASKRRIHKLIALRIERFFTRDRHA